MAKAKKASKKEETKKEKATAVTVVLVKIEGDTITLVFSDGTEVTHKISAGG